MFPWRKPKAVASAGMRVAAPWNWCQPTDERGDVLRATAVMIASRAPGVSAGRERVRISQWQPSASASHASMGASLSV
jgi:hypothetical protein